MTISVDPETRVIGILQADLTWISGTLYELDVGWLFDQLKDWEDDEVGMSMPDTQRHSPAFTLSGVTYVQTVEIINLYTITFEDTGSPYAVRCIGANHNIADVTNYTSEVSLIIGNSGGLIITEVPVPIDLTPAEIWSFILTSGFSANSELISSRYSAGVAALEADLAKDQATLAKENAADAETAAIAANSNAVIAATAAQAAQTATIATQAAVAALDAPDNVSIGEIHEAHFNRRTWNKIANTITIYDIDGVTPLYVFDTNSDLSDINPQ